MMCKNCFEEYSDSTKKTMLLCRLVDKKESLLKRMCSFQRYCSEKDKYIPNKQKEGCKEYK